MNGSQETTVTGLVTHSFCLTGSLPLSIGNLSDLTQLDISLNDLNGALPDSIYGLNKLSILSAFSNLLTGSLSTKVSLLPNLKLLLLSHNKFSGTLPMELGYLPLNYLEVSNNQFSGKLPRSLGLLTNVFDLLIANNRLTSTIPNSLCNLHNLLFFDLSTNNLNGSIPNCFGQLSILQFLFLYENELTGTIPASLGLLTNLNEIYLYNNMLTGTIPKNFTTCVSAANTICSLGYLEVFSNMLTGSIPQDLFLISSLYSFLISDNYLTGPLPYQLPMNEATGDMVSYIFELYCNENYLTGILPYSIQYMTDLILLKMNNNFFTGQVHSSIFIGPSLQLADLYSNLFTGSLPSSIGSAKVLRELFINDNLLTGKFFELFNTSTQILQLLNCANNIFTGTIPDDFFNLSILSVISAGSNCFTGTLPSTICNNQDFLSYVVLDGAGGNGNCDVNANLNDARPFFVKGKFSNLGLHGTIPSCLFASTKLTVLHLSDNVFYGTIGEIPSDSLLTDLSLSNNALTGTIPYSIQRHYFDRLDLSHNRLDGTLVNDFYVTPTQSELSLAVNRLSGPLPNTLKEPSMGKYHNLSTLNILVSNIYLCNNQLIPSKDDYALGYSCGSYELNVATFVWIGVVGTIALCVALLMGFLWINQYFVINWITSWKRRVEHIKLQFLRWRNTVKLLITPQRHINRELAKDDSLESYLVICKDIKLNETKSFIIVLEIFRSWCNVMAFLIIIVYLPVYISLDPVSAIVSYSYAYIVSMTFLHGYAPVIFIGTSVFLILVAMTLVINAFEEKFLKSLHTS